MKKVLENFRLVGKFRPVQICLECKRAGITKMTSTVWEMISHLVEAHNE